MNSIIKIHNLDKIYEGGFQALKSVSLEIKQGEIFGLLGPNGAGKTTLIRTICGISTATRGSVTVGGFDIEKQYKQARGLIGLVPQELTTDAFEKVIDTVSFSRGLFGKTPDPAHIEKTLKALSLWDKKDNRLMTLSGGMKRRVMIAKALSHEPSILFLDEPTAGVDVELRKGMWSQVRALRDAGVTVILTTHYLEEAEEMADRIGVISRGELILVEKKAELMQKLGTKQLVVDLARPLSSLPEPLDQEGLSLSGSKLIYTYDPKRKDQHICNLLDTLKSLSIDFNDLSTKQSSLEDIFVELVKQP